MTSINFERRQILSRDPKSLPGDCDRNCILLITAGLDDLPGVEVSDTERERASEMEDMTARRFLAARRVTRGILSNLLGIPADTVELDIDANGKPLLSGADYHFSIAHCGKTVAVAISRSAVGVDLEAERPLDIPALAARFFSNGEAKFLGNNPDPGHFFRLWTCREAAAKADGRGLAKLLGRIGVSTEPDPSTAMIDVTIGGEQWTAWHRSEPSRLHLALAFQQHPSLISWCDFRREVIL